MNWQELSPLITLLVGVLGAVGGWIAGRPKDKAEVRATEAKTDIDMAGAMQTQYAKLVADLSAEVDRRQAITNGLRIDLETSKAECRKRIDELEVDRASMGADMGILTKRIEELEARLRAAGLDANGVH